MPMKVKKKRSRLHFIPLYAAVFLGSIGASSIGVEKAAAAAPGCSSVKAYDGDITPQGQWGTPNPWTGLCRGLPQIDCGGGPLEY
jgi:hypothetical protein